MSQFYMPQMDEDTQTRLFTALVKSGFQMCGFSAEISKLDLKIVVCTQEVIRQLPLKATPLKCHYNYRSRDAFTIIKRMMNSDSERVAHQDQLLKLWVHETWNTIGDYLVDEKEKQQLVRVIRLALNKNCNINLDVLLSSQGTPNSSTNEKLELLLWSDILHPNEKYQEIQNIQNLNQYILQQQGMVLTSSGIRYLLRIWRTLRSKEPLILVGPIGCGKASLTKMAANLAYLSFEQIEYMEDFELKQYIK